MAENTQKQKEAPAESGLRHLVRIMNTDLLGSKCLITALQKIKGVGFAFANTICCITGLDKNMRAGKLTQKDVDNIEDVLKNPAKHKIPEWMLNRRKDYETGNDIHLFKSDLDFTLSNDIRRLQKIKSNRGLRHAWGLPVRGQKTKSNFRKSKGKTLGVKRKKK